ncbi:MAG: hypothetical protein ACLQVF_28255 [Isosphaeraceae bacterium]
MKSLTNDQMKAGRYLRWQQARLLHSRIQHHLRKGGCVLVATYAKCWVHRDPDQFRCSRDGVYVRRGQQWDCINHCAVRFY